MQQKIYYNPQQYYQTNSKGLINKNTFIRGKNKINIIGKVLLLEKIILRGDFSFVTMGKYIVIQEGVILRPPYRMHKGKISFMPVQIHDYVVVKQNTILQAHSVGSCVEIGRNCVIGQRAVVMDNVQVLDDTVVPPDSVLTAYGVYGGKPAQLVGQLHESWTSQQKLSASKLYNSYTPKRRKRAETVAHP